MSMGNIESYHQVISQDTVQKVVGKQILDQFLSRIKPYIDDFSDEEVYDTLNEDPATIDIDEAGWQAVEAAFKKVRETFSKQTGMHLCYTFLGGDGDCYDDLESGEWYWELWGGDVWVPKQLTEKAQDFIKKFGEIELDQRFSRYG